MGPTKQEKVMNSKVPTGRGYVTVRGLVAVEFFLQNPLENS